jgi:hypothetical protein
MATAYSEEACQVTLGHRDRLWYLTFDDPTDRLAADIRALPWRERNYNPKHDEWIITEAGMRLLTQGYSRLREQMDETLSREARESAKQRRSHTRASTGGFTHTSRLATHDASPVIQQAFAALYLTPDAPFVVIRAAYRALALASHPDRGGDTAKMISINAAYATAIAWAKKGARASA